MEWREGNLTQAEKNGRAALELWPKHYILFLWMALWPLIGVALAQGRVAEAIDHARTLLDPKQSRLPDAITAALEQAIQAWDKPELEAARAQLQQASELAGQKGYL